MTLQSPLPPNLAQPVPFLPDSAPFSPEQRAWLNGFFAGIFSGTAAPGATALSAEASAALMPGTAAEEDDGAPWHDAAMPLAERMKLAEGRPLSRRMMAAMAQQDCGQCGYV
ncbi:MAG: sulfite reductase, partial [Rhizobiales bacterium 12-68-15]